MINEGPIPTCVHGWFYVLKDMFDFNQTFMSEHLIKLIGSDYIKPMYQTTKSRAT